MLLGEALAKAGIVPAARVHAFDHGCRFKIRHENFVSALFQIDEIKSRPNYADEDAYTLAAYQCRHCGGWHVGRSRYRVTERS